MRVEDQRVLGIHRLRAQLKQIVCKRAISSLAYFFCECAADSVESEMPWSALEDISCVSKSVTDLDRALGVLPRAVRLNLHDNNITELSSQLVCLRALEELVFSCNQIVTLRPLLQPGSARYLSRLTVLNLSSNKIESLHGVERLTALVKLDVAHNEICDLDEVRRLIHLEALRHLWLEGNPVSYERHYRARVLALIPQWERFMLDGKVSAALEEQLIVEHHIEKASGAIGGGHGVMPAQAAANQQEAPNWKCDASCYSCGARFTWAFGSTPRHHCRQCGNSVCHRHSQNVLPLPHFGDEYDGPERVCDNCFRDLVQPAQPANDTLDLNISGTEPKEPKLSAASLPVQTGMPIVGDTPINMAPGLSPIATPESSPDRPRPRTRPKSVEIAESDAVIASVVEPKGKNKKRKGKRKKRIASKVLEEQDSLRAQVDQIFETGGESALAIYQAWVDENNPEENIASANSLKEQGILSELASNPDISQVVNTTSNDSLIQEAISVGQSVDLEIEDENSHVGLPVQQSTPLLRRSESRTGRDRQSNVSEGSTTPANMDASIDVVSGDVFGTGYSELNTNADVVIAASDPDLLGKSLREEKAMESTDEFLVDLFDRDGHTDNRMLQVYGNSKILVMDTDTAKSRDMWDLTCLIDATTGKSARSINAHQALLSQQVTLSFIYGRKDRRVKHFYMESVEETEQFLELMSPVIQRNRKLRVNDNSLFYKCLKCNAVFAHEGEQLEGVSVACVFCHSNQVIEILSHQTTDTTANAHADADEQRKNSLGRYSSCSSRKSPALNDDTLPYSSIPTDDVADCRIIDHNRKLLLDLEHFAEGEKCLGGIGCSVHVGSMKIQPVFVVGSSAALYLIDCPEDGSMKIIRKDRYVSIHRIDVSVDSQRLRFILEGDRFFDLLIGDDAKTWGFLQMLSEVPYLSGCNLHVDCSFSDALSYHIPEALVQGTLILGTMKDMMVDTAVATEMCRKSAIIEEMEGNPIHFCLLANVSTVDTPLCLVVGLDDSVRIFTLYAKDNVLGASLDSLEEVEVIDLNDVEKIMYSSKEPRCAHIIYWGEGRMTPEDMAVPIIITMETSRTLHTFITKMNARWSLNFGFDLPLVPK